MQVLEILKQVDWLDEPTVLEEGIECEGYTPAGENFGFYLSGETEKELANSLRQYADYFDVDEHVELWVDKRGKNGVPNSIRELVEDAAWIKTELDKIAELI